MTTVIDIPASEDSLVLLDYWDGPKVFANLSRVRADGTEVWTAPPPLPTSPDAWTQVRIESGLVVAHSWSGYVVHLDVETGQERLREFVK
jgi:hypothetical protein